ncbi:cytochrome c biogenesis protein CcdA [Psychromarinibacter sp. C21-152]|uniref:Cytochrome c biogenesis protein CcdA n=1 Tax=Psychromarinibacter sediminicola TaxID=3033385 RepID=A0AAE3NT07_9RHOB|nr:cytochrome c biogenesis protein CcdA [Psychromarinibacter sediminicola]MDF0600017.1 cytochrome c biogenesis protein CcdA [Psychromarinibacter sediminicola]
MFDVTLAGALLAGLLSFLSPCILPIVPFYLSYLAGSGVATLQDGAPLPPGVQRRAFFSALAFAAGVATIFVGLGAAATAFGQFVRDWFDVLRWVAAAIIIVMGLHFLGVIRIGFLYRQFRSEAGSTDGTTVAGAFVIGLAFAFGWTPCVGPVLAAILFMAGGQETVGQGMGLLLTYAVGMTAPFVLAALFIRPFLRWMRGFRKHLGTIEKVMGALLVLFGVLIATETVNYIANWMVQFWPNIG